MTVLPPNDPALQVPPAGWDKLLFDAYQIKKVLDVGSNLGGFIPSWLGNGAELVHAIEPVPEVFAKLEQAFAGDPRVECHRLGVSDRLGKLSGVNVFNAWTLQENHAKTYHRAFDFVDTPPFDVDLFAISDLLWHWGFAPDFIKIDVDGYDVRALLGAREYIERRRPVLMLEISYMPEVTLGDCYACEIRKLYELGYEITKMNGGIPLPTMKDFMRIFPWDTSFDVLCEPIGGVRP